MYRRTTSLLPPAGWLCSRENSLAAFDLGLIQIPLQPYCGFKGRDTHLEGGILTLPDLSRLQVAHGRAENHQGENHSKAQSELLPKR